MSLILSSRFCLEGSDAHRGRPCSDYIKLTRYLIRWRYSPTPRAADPAGAGGSWARVGAANCGVLAAIPTLGDSISISAPIPPTCGEHPQFARSRCARRASHFRQLPAGRLTGSVGRRAPFQGAHAGSARSSGVPSPGCDPYARPVPPGAASGACCGSRPSRRPPPADRPSRPEHARPDVPVGRGPACSYNGTPVRPRPVRPAARPAPPAPRLRMRAATSGTADRSGTCGSAGRRGRPTRGLRGRTGPVAGRPRPLPPACHPPPAFPHGASQHPVQPTPLARAQPGRDFRGPGSFRTFV
jgi:hypothetical protein